jgi:hypothetical protein
MPASIPESTVEEVILQSDIHVEKTGHKTTVLHAILPNTFEVTVTSACNEPADYDKEVGRKICMRRLKDKVWELMAYEAHGGLL